MPRTTTTYVIQDEIRRLETKREELADAVAEMDDDERHGENQAYVSKTQRGTTLDTHLGGLRGLRDEYGPDAEIVVGGLTTGEHGYVQDRVGAAKEERVGFGDSDEGLARTFWCAAGLVDAPFIDVDDPGFEDFARAVRELPPQTTSWLEERINEETSVGVEEGNSFGALVAEKTQNRRETSSSSTPKQP